MSTVFRVEKNANFTVMSNIHLKDRQLSLRAKGLLSVILSLPPEWDYTITGLAKITADGVESVRSAVKELEKSGYITRRQLRDEHGRMAQNEYHVYEDPKQNPEFSAQSEQTDNIFLASPSAAEPLREIPSTAKPAAHTFNKLNTKKSNTHSSITQPRASRSDGGTEDREQFFSLISENIESDCFPEDEGANELVDLMTDVVCSNRQTVRVNGGELPLEQVKQRFLELRREHIENVLDTLKKNAKEVRNRRAYLITLLYNAPAEAKKSRSDSEFEYDEYGMQKSSITDEMMRRIMARYGG